MVQKIALYWPVLQVFRFSVSRQSLDAVMQIKKGEIGQHPKMPPVRSVVELHPKMIQIQQIFASCDDPLSVQISG